MAFPLILLHADSFIKQYTITLFDVSATLSGFINATGYLRMWQRYKALEKLIWCQTTNTFNYLKFAW